MFGRKKKTKNDFYEYVINNDDSVSKYLPILSNELYDRFISENTKKTLGIKQFYVDGVESTVKLNEKATDLDTVIAINELTDLLNKVQAFGKLLKNKAQSNYHQFVDALIDKNTFNEAQKTPIILSLEDLIKGIEEQPAPEHALFTDEEIASGNFSRVTSNELRCKMSILKLNIRVCLISVTFGMRINSNDVKIPR